MHQSERPSTMLVILLMPLAGSHSTECIASKAACLKPSTDTNHCMRTHTHCFLQTTPPYSTMLAGTPLRHKAIGCYEERCNGMLMICCSEMERSRT